MAIVWGGWNNHVRVGIDVWTDGYDTWTPTINVHVAVHVNVGSWSFSDSQHVNLWGAVSGSWDFFNDMGQNQSRHIGTVTIWNQGQNYNGGPRYELWADVTGNYLGGTSTVYRTFDLPARPRRAPAPPGHGPNFDQRHADRVYLNWGETPDAGGGFLIEDRLQVSRNSNFTDLAHDSFAGGTERWAGRLAPGTRYWARAAVRSDIGWSGWSAVTSDWTLPYKTLSVAASDLGPDSARITWASPTDPAEVGGSTEVQIAQDPNFTIGLQWNYQHESAPRNAYTWTGLSPATRYYVRVRTGVRDGWGAFSDTINFETLSGAKVFHEGQWRDAVAYVRDAGQWKQAKVYKRKNGVWVL